MTFCIIKCWKSWLLGLPLEFLVALKGSHTAQAELSQSNSSQNKDQASQGAGGWCKSFLGNLPRLCSSKDLAKAVPITRTLTVLYVHLLSNKIKQMGKLIIHHKLHYFCQYNSHLHLTYFSMSYAYKTSATNCHGNLSFL